MKKKIEQILYNLELELQRAISISDMKRVANIDGKIEAYRHSLYMLNNE